MRRDVRKHPFIGSGDLGEVVAALLRATEAIAAEMTETTAKAVRLTESLPLDAVREIVDRETTFDVADVVTNSFLMAIRSQSGVRVVFAFRVLQEYFLATYLRHSGQASNAYPDEVRGLYEELAEP